VRSSAQGANTCWLSSNQLFRSSQLTDELPPAEYCAAYLKKPALLLALLKFNRKLLGA
jgi:hypothetical protein